MLWLVEESWYLQQGWSHGRHTDASEDGAGRQRGVTWNTISSLFLSFQMSYLCPLLVEHLHDEGGLGIMACWDSHRSIFIQIRAGLVWGMDLRTNNSWFLTKSTLKMLFEKSFSPFLDPGLSHHPTPQHSLLTSSVGLVWCPDDTVSTEQYEWMNEWYCWNMSV